ncbi:MAG: family 20 glycosylhydrolase [Crocinitomix sp.]|nr:family 20 glycosylhydrolase [Crocinitomix sp.]
MKFILPLFLILFPVSCSQNTQSVSIEDDLGDPKAVSIIPMPLEIEEMGTNYRIDNKSMLYLHGHQDDLNSNAEYLKNRLELAATDASITISNETSTEKGIHFIINETYDNDLGEEGYRLSADQNLFITANKPAGIFYGIQTLLQLMPSAVFGTEGELSEFNIPALEITDVPRYEYRGMHLDPCRHFFSVEFTKKYLDYMAYHKLNKFHWHLTEDQGWRIEIKKYPKLVEMGSKRGGTLVLNHEVKWNEQKYDSIPVEGYYTQAEIKEIVAYAALRHIEVIPEIEMPGHSIAALVGYPQLSCTGGPFEVLQRPGVIPDVYCAGNDSVFTFLKDIIDEVTELFPSQYIHIGGDECPKERWEACDKCQKRMQDNGLANEHELQSWFISEMEKHINEKGKTLIGWSEIMEGGIAPNAVLQSWLGTTAGVEAAKEQHKAIMSPYQYLYFDGIYVDKAHKEMEPFGQSYCWTNTEKVYSFDPTPDTIPAEYHPYFIGAEATMWTEFIKTEEHLEYMLMPRISALAEICWTAKDRKDLQGFLVRLDEQYGRYDMMGANYRIPHPILEDTVFIGLGDSIEIGHSSNICEIRYTLNGTEPDENSTLYTEPFTASDNTILKSRAFMSNGKKSSITTALVRIDL